MKKIVVLFLTLMFAFGLSAATKNVLNIVMPDDTLNFRFASNQEGTAITESPSFYLWKAEIPAVSTSEPVTDDDKKSYVLAYTSFYVWYDAFIGYSVKLQLQVPAAFKNEDKTMSIPVANTSTTGVGNEPFSDGKLIENTGEESINVDVVSLDDNMVYRGCQKYYLVLDIRNARNGVTYMGDVVLKVVTAS